ncbi:MAG: hypothetical protein J6I31_08780 [Prevotella sp.]|nr:hypothetical protein [Prevotella sp.]
MKQALRNMMMLALLLWTTGAAAESYTGTIERFGEKLKYTIKGGTVTSKEGPWLPPTDRIISPDVKAWGVIRMDVEPGEVITLTAEREKGTSEWYKKCEVYIGEKKVVGEGKATFSMKVPDTAEDLTAKLIYYGKNSILEYNIFYTVKKKVNTSAETYRGKAEVVIAGEDPDGYINYTVTGRNFRKYGPNSDDLQADFFVGEKVTVTCEGTTASAGDPYETRIQYGNDERKKLNGSVSATYTIDKNTDKIYIRGCMNALSGMGDDIAFQNCGGVTVHVNIIDPNSTTTTPATNIKWNDVVYDNNCNVCGSEYSEFKPADYSGSYTCTKDPKKEEHDIVPGKTIYGNTMIKTGDRELGIDHGDQHKAIVIEKNSVVEFTNDQGVQIWTVHKGGIRGINLKPLKGSGGSFLFYTPRPQVQAIPFGTVFVIQANNNTSRVYLLSGSMEVTSKKTGKKVTLKPGQASTVGTDGQQKVQQFDIKKAAKKFGITDAQLQGETATTATTTRRYELERAVVKYRVTRGSQQGVMGKCFDNYGSMERRELRMGDQTTLQLTQGNSSYSLNTQAKTYTQVTNAELNFLNMNAPVMLKLKLKKKGTAKVLNRECTIYANTDTEYYVWKGIVLKKVAHTKKGTTTTEATSVELPASVDAKYFNMPAGYRKK